MKPSILGTVASAFIALFAAILMLPLARAQQKPTNEPGKAAKDGRISFEKQVFPLLQRRCSECHVGDTAEGEYRLDDARSSYKAMINMPSTQRPKVVLVKPGKPKESWLWLKMIGAQDYGDKMPPKEMMPDEEKQLIERWILQESTIQRPDSKVEPKSR